MSSYEFWDELGKIFNAVVAYQEKTIEFNKRFINPWIRLGNVFDKQDRNNEAICAYQKAIEIDPNNAQNWYELGNLYFHANAYDEAVEAYNKAIALKPDLGWAYNNLALTLVSKGNCAEAIAFYQKSIELLEESKDKAVAWNRLGNVYRKLNEYEQAVEAFQKADELDKENAGFRDDLDEIPASPTLVEKNNGENAEQAAGVTISPIQLILAESRVEESATAENPPATDSSASDVISEKPAEAAETTLEETAPAVTDQPAGEIEASISEPSAEIQPQAATETLPDAPTDAVGNLQAAQDTLKTEQADSDAVAAPVAETESLTSEAAQEPADDANNVPASVEDAAKETVTLVVQNTVATFTESLPVSDTATETSDAALAPAENLPQPALDLTEAVAVDSVPQEQAEPAEAQVGEEAVAQDEVEVDTAGLEVRDEAEEPVARQIEETQEEAAQTDTSLAENVPLSGHVAYEEYLRDNEEHFEVALAVEPADETSQDKQSAPPQEPVAKIDSSGEIQIEVDTKNAHVWNELGNVYFNNGAHDDAVIAYSKAIELDRQFAWPYSNLALTYVQKGRFTEAILLYQRSIELFASEKDKAISWNRLGNVFRRLNDYDNAIAAYQRADELDPDNTALSLQSRFSLLGSYHLEQSSSYIA